MKNIKIIESFLSSEMNELERKDFILEMKQNKDLATDVALHEEVNEAIADDLVHEFRKSINEIIVTSREKQPKSILLSRKLVKYPLAASICLLIGFSLWQVLSITQPEKIYQKYYKPYEADLATRSSLVLEDKSSVAIKLYDKKEFEAAFEIFHNYLANNYGDQTARFYYAMSSLELGKIDIAINELKQVEKDHSSNYSLHAQWYLAMAYLKEKNNKEAYLILKSIASENNFYSNRAEIILKKLKV